MGQKVFNWQRFICTEVTSYKIHTLVIFAKIHIKSFDKENSMLNKNSLTTGLKLTTTNSVHLSRDMAFLMFCFHRRPKANQSAWERGKTRHSGLLESYLDPAFNFILAFDCQQLYSRLLQRGCSNSDFQSFRHFLVNSKHSVNLFFKMYKVLENQNEYYVLCIRTRVLVIQGKMY